MYDDTAFVVCVYCKDDDDLRLMMLMITSGLEKNHLYLREATLTQYLFSPVRVIVTEYDVS
jgi:hypothetical protein